VDFSLILFVILCVTGLIWGLDRWLLAPAHARKAGAHTARKEPVYVEYARAFFPVILIVFLLRSFVAEPFRIPSGSMLPSLFIGDFILVNKFAYGVRLPIVNVKALDTGAPRRGDVAVFRFPGDPSVNYIKRVIGLPGDHVAYRGKKVYINGKVLEQTAAGAYSPPLPNTAAGEVLRQVEEIDGLRHDILTTDRADYSPSEFVVPAGQFFVMGDNRDHSNDSRYWGYVPDENLVGRAFLIWFSCDMTDPTPLICGRVLWDRIGNTIR